MTIANLRFDRVHDVLTTELQAATVQTTTGVRSSNSDCACDAV